MKFTILKWKPNSENNHKNECVLVKDNWDDYSYKTTFYLYYYDGKNEEHNIGSIKIIQKDMPHGYTPLPHNNPFTHLDETYCSLGQGQSFYEQLMSLDEHIKDDILKSLKDCVHQIDIYNEFNNDGAFIESLLRSISTHQIEITYKSILEGKIALTPYSFDIIINKENKPKISINVTPYSLPPTNMHVIIGRNASGKTQLISSIISSLTKNEDMKLKFKVGINFDSSEERFTKVVSVVFSPFDNAKPPKEMTRLQESKSEDFIEYDYIGLKMWGKVEGKKEKEIIFKSPRVLHKELKESFLKCRKGSYVKRLQKSLEILSSDPIFEKHDFNTLIEMEEGEILNTQLNILCTNLSSGHKIILLSMLKLVELVEEKTLVLIDEAENHLHPPLLSAYLRAISELMRNRNGVAIIATHSPVVIQEVPKNCVSIINRYGNRMKIDKPRIETFGENVGTLTH
ncbi:MAG: ATP-binding protein, partial [Alphaproteobacteria bacterium]|nr:ATP-binding protein [Alphaproteobacteria bacterium]